MANLVNKVIGVVKYIEPKKATGFGAVAGTIKKPEGYDKDIVFWFSDNKHVMCLANKTGSEEIYPGQKVIFEIRQDKKGRFEAINVHDARSYAAPVEATEEAVEETVEETSEVEKTFTEEVIEEEETLVADEDFNEEESEYIDDEDYEESDSEDEEESEEDDSYSKYDDKYFEYEDEYSEVYDDENL